MPYAPCPFTRELARITCVKTWPLLLPPGRRIFRNYDRSASFSPAAFHHEGRLDYPFDPRSHECARTKPKPCGSARPGRRQDRAPLSQGRGGALFYSRRRGRDRARRRRSYGRPGRCDPHPAGRMARDHGYRAATLSLLLRTSLFARGYVFRVTESKDCPFPLPEGMMRLLNFSFLLHPSVHRLLLITRTSLSCSNLKNPIP